MPESVGCLRAPACQETGVGPFLASSSRLAPQGGGSGLVWHKGEHRQMPGALDSKAQRSLVFCADSRPAARLDLGAVRDEAPDAFNVFVVDTFDVIYAKGTDPAPRGEPASASSAGPSSAPGRRASAGSSWWCGHAFSDPPVYALIFEKAKAFDFFVRFSNTEHLILKKAGRPRHPSAVHPHQVLPCPRRLRQTRTRSRRRPRLEAGSKTGHR